MSHYEHGPTVPAHEPPMDRNRFPAYGWVVLGLAVIGLIGYLVSDHWTHLVAALPYVGIILFTVMHLFMHKGHSHDRGTSSGHDHGPTGNGPEK